MISDKFFLISNNKLCDILKQILWYFYSYFNDRNLRQYIDLNLLPLPVLEKWKNYRVRVLISKLEHSMRNYSIPFSLEIILSVFNASWWGFILDERKQLKRFRIFLLTSSVHVSCQCEFLVDAVADFALVFAVILQSDVLDLQVGADYLIALPVNKDKNNW